MLIKSVRRLMKKDVSFIPVFNQLRVGKPAAARLPFRLRADFSFRAAFSATHF